MAIAKWSSRANPSSSNFMDLNSKTDLPTVRTGNSNNILIPICERGLVDRDSNLNPSHNNKSLISNIGTKDTPDLGLHIISGSQDESECKVCRLLLLCCVRAHHTCLGTLNYLLRRSRENSCVYLNAKPNQGDEYITRTASKSQKTYAVRPLPDGVDAASHIDDTQRHSFSASAFAFSLSSRYAPVESASKLYSSEED